MRDSVLLLVVGRLIPLVVLGGVLYAIVWRELFRPRLRHILPGVRCMYCRPPDVRVLAEERYMEGDVMVIVRSTLRGTHRGELFGDVGRAHHQGRRHTLIIACSSSRWSLHVHEQRDTSHRGEERL